LKEKIRSLDELAQILDQRGEETVVLAHGTFDLMHLGHIRYLKRAAEQGQCLVVTLTADAFVNRGPGRPVFNETQRAEALAALDCVNFVAINSSATAIEAIELLKPDFYAKGSEYQDESKDVTGNIRLEREAVEACGGQMFFSHEPTFSSSRLLNAYFDVFSPAVQSYLNEFKSFCPSAEAVDAAINNACGNMNVLVVGDAIIDEYITTSPLGMTGKSNMLAFSYCDKERHAGGVFSVANHIAGFVSSVTIATGLGERESCEAIIREKLAKNVEPVFFKAKDRDTLIKTRYISGDYSKLFEVYNQAQFVLDDESQQAMLHWLREKVADYDLVIVPDYGNGLINDEMVQVLSDNAKYLAVNTQINSGNRGYHVITRYPRADFISLNEPELRLAKHDNRNSIDLVASQLSKDMGAQVVAVTRGKHGVCYCDMSEGRIHEAPALSTNVVDRIGAGDIFLALASLAAAAKLDARLVVFIASAAAAIGVQIVGNREFINPASLSKYFSSLMK